jgi:antitoxin component YwqK of YwqJK toxin-antitoxin module
MIETKLRILIFILFLSVGCQNQSNYSSERDFVIYKRDTFEGRLNSEVLVNKFDNSRSLIILYWYNGKTMSKTYYKGSLKDGEAEAFYISGNLMLSEFYEMGQKEGKQKFYHLNGKLKRMENYRKGVLLFTENFDSLGNKLN